MAEVIDGQFPIQNPEQLAILSLSDGKCDGCGGGGIEGKTHLVQGSSGTVYISQHQEGPYFGAGKDVLLGPQVE